MIREIEISTMEDLFRMVSEQEYREDLGRHRNLFIYRGEPNASYTLSTSLRRHCKDKSKLLEPPMLLNFTKYAVLEEPTIQDSVWNQMILGQHHGLPTRLLDWSFSPMIALHFAMTEDDLEEMDAHDAVIWRIDIHELHDMLPRKYRAIIDKYNTTVFSVDMLKEVCSSLDQYDEDMQNQSIVIIEPPSLDPRIVNQYSFFSIIPDPMDDIVDFLKTHTSLTARFIIRKELRWRIRDMLDHQNITERIVYPGLDGLSRWLGRHYFVRD
ncbi:MAG: FRG domain-containing protein [Eubacteriales bacterium]|nr:FRG domain-containing protein [Eubacteriales bacterium]